MPAYKFIRDHNLSGLAVKAGDEMELEVEDAMDLPVVPSAEYKEPKVEKKVEKEMEKPAAKKPAAKKAK